jgi:hypothetical protein
LGSGAMGQADPISGETLFYHDDPKKLVVMSIGKLSFVYYRLFIESAVLSNQFHYPKSIAVFMA